MPSKKMINQKNKVKSIQLINNNSIIGFATYVQYIGTQVAIPESEYRDRVLMAMHIVFEDDALESSKAITNEVSNPDYDAFFGSIAYKKGACIIRMIENFMTEDKLNLGVSQYLKKFEYSNAETKDLWEALNNVADPESLPLELPQIMSSWTDQPGYPVVEYDGTKLKQERFLLNTTG